MYLGIDFGTTHTVVTAVDRGNYPVVGFESADGEQLPWYPATVAACAGRLVYGLDARTRECQRGWGLVRSLKPYLETAGPDTPIRIGDTEIPLLEALTGYLQQLRKDLKTRSNLDAAHNSVLETWIAVPANANSNQRFLTLEAFRRAGFRVLGMVNEPSAAGIEYVHHFARKGPRKEYLAIYDLGGGTFDVSLIGVKQHLYDILTSEGITTLGGNNFDQVLLDLALERAGHQDPLTANTRFHLLEECRERKEGLHANTRKIAIDLGRGLPGREEVVVSVKDYYRRCGPLVERTIEATDQALRRLAAANADQAGVEAQLAAVYLVGGGCALPLVARQLRKHYGRKMRKSPYPHAATAIGLAVAADSDTGIEVRERFTRHFGVWRETQDGHQISFDPIFPKDTPLPTPDQQPLVHTRHYCPVHNIGHYRYLECSRVDDAGMPRGDITPWDEVLFPIDPALLDRQRLEGVEVVRASQPNREQVIEERYACDSQGVIQVTIANHSAGYQRTFQLRA